MSRLTSREVAALIHAGNLALADDWDPSLFADDEDEMERTREALDTAVDKLKARRP